LREEVVLPKSNGIYSDHDTNGQEQVALFDAPQLKGKALPKATPLRYTAKRNK